ncbi:MAG TPA: hypothetical protein VKG91_16200 [Roseiarcus sp.]|nr:hypothetical protein [Roseiarcus sp.]
MTHGALRVSAIALGVAAFVSLSPLPTARADTSAPSGATSATSEATSAPNAATLAPNAATPSLSEPAPTPGWAEAGPQDVQQPSRHYAHHYTRRYAWQNGHRYAYYSNNPVASAATGVVGSVADLGSLAAYPFYCLPRYGSCPVYWPYR